MTSAAHLRFAEGFWRSRSQTSDVSELSELTMMNLRQNRTPQPLL